MFTYRLHLEDGSDVGEATYPSMVKVGEELFFGGGQRFRVLDVVSFDEEDESVFGGCYRSRPRSRCASGRRLAVKDPRPLLGSAVSCLVTTG
jgi:hypothetical protein